MLEGFQNFEIIKIYCQTILTRSFFPRELERTFTPLLKKSFGIIVAGAFVSKIKRVILLGVT